MGSKWREWKDVKGTCPLCGKPAHIGKKRETRVYYWLHNNIDDYYDFHMKLGELVEIPEEEGRALVANSASTFKQE